MMNKQIMFVFGIFLVLMLSFFSINAVLANEIEISESNLLKQEDLSSKGKGNQCEWHPGKPKKCDSNIYFYKIINVSECRDLNESESIYVLQNNIINYDGTCFSITANNIILDGAGYTISGTNDIYNVYWGVLVEGRNNVTIRNLTINNFGDTYLDYDTTDDGGGVKLFNTNESYIYSVSTSLGNTGISLENSYNNNIFSLNSFGNYRGIKLVNSLYNSFEGKSLESSGADLVCSYSDSNYNLGLNYSTNNDCLWI